MIRCINIYCGSTDEIQSHHLIPKPFRKAFIGKIPRVHLCDDCHRRVHKLKTNTELFLYHSTKKGIIDLLASDAEYRVQRMFYVTNIEYRAVA